ncbi:c-type cytochrome [Pseudoruegeria sp. HB172150]|uniref:c-type cytochrome n=1 Tax=Pseudoruegeria sp. HB172150 TaxID=2721164 RepID=UPI0015571E6D|nr:c-type cytochrome [Pseudoruegeria sp. HB172150]
MSKSLSAFLIPAVGGAALVLGVGYGLATRSYRASEAEVALAQASAAEERASAEADKVAALTIEVDKLTAAETELTLQIEGLKTASAPARLGDPLPEDETFDLGRTATIDEVAAWNIDVRPDGQGLPLGSGDVMTGEELYTDNCAMCHGDFGEAIDRWPVLAGGNGTLASENPVKTIGSYWPYLSTVYDYVHRAMPFGNAQSLSGDDVYSIVAYLLYLNDLVDEDFELSNENFTGIQLPNEDNFFLDDRTEGELASFSADACMENCKDTVEITARAAVIDVTPDDTAARARREAAATDSGDTVVVEASAETPAREETAAAIEEADDVALVAAGETAFKKCKTCHQVGEGAKNRTGPVLNGIFGRVAGSVDGFRYSNPFKVLHDEGFTWTEERVAEFLAQPKSYIKGTKMSFAGFDDEGDIEAVVAYLKAFDE